MVQTRRASSDAVADHSHSQVVCKSRRGSTRQRLLGGRGRTSATVVSDWRNGRVFDVRTRTGGTLTVGLYAGLRSPVRGRGFIKPELGRIAVRGHRSRSVSAGSRIAGAVSRRRRCGPVWPLMDNRAHRFLETVPQASGAVWGIAGSGDARRRVRSASAGARPDFWAGARMRTRGSNHWAAVHDGLSS